MQLPRVFTPPLRDLSDEDASWGHDFAWFCEAILEDPLSDWQDWLGLRVLEVLTKEKAIEFAMLEDDPAAELEKIERLYTPGKRVGVRAIPGGRLRFIKVVILIARQNGKTDFVKKLIKWALFRKRLSEILAAAQTLNAAMGLWDEILREIQKHPKLSKLIEAPVLRNGAQTVWTKNKLGRYRPVGIDENAGRGETIDLLYIDELRTQKTFEGVNSLESTITVPDNGLLITTSNAGSDHSVVLREFRDLATKPIDNDTWHDTRQAIFEWSADPMADIDDEEQWKQANPDLGNGRITLATLRAARESTPENTFRTERLCQWVDELDEDIQPVMDLARWQRNSVEEMIELGDRGLAVEVSPTTGRVKFVSVGRTTRGYHAEVAPLDETMTVDEVVQAVFRFVRANDPVAIVLDDKTDAVSYVEPLKRAGIEPVTIGYGNLGKAFRLMLARFDDGQLTNDGSDVWLRELRTTKTRAVNGGREVLIDRYKSEPQSLVALSLALWGLETFAPAEPQVEVKMDSPIIKNIKSGVVPMAAPAWSGNGRKLGKWS